MPFQLNKRLVIINGENNSGSAILINSQALVISCYHNFYDKTTNEPNIIKSLSIKSEGFWREIPYANNVDFCFPETKYDDLEFDDIFLFRLKIDKNSNGIKDLPKLSVSRNVKEGDEVTVVAWDNTYDKNLVEHSGKVISIEPKTKDHPNRFHIKLDGYPGYSGGGVFKNGELVGIINYIQTQRLNNIIASFIPNYIINYINEEIEEAQTTTNPSTNSFSPTQVDSSIINPNQINSSLLPSLENRKQELIDDIAAAYKQLGTSLSEVDKTRINRQIKDLENQLAQIQNKIDSSTNVTSQNQSQPKIDIKPNQKAISMDRKTLFNKLSALVPADFDQLLFEINPKKGSIPHKSSPQAERVSALLEWAESPTGRGLAEIEEVLQTILNPQ